MISRKVPKDVTKYQTKLFGPFTARQIFCLALGGAVGISVFFMIRSFAGEAAMFIGGMIALPFFCAGFIKLYGMPFEQYVLLILKDNFTTPATRKYKTKNLYDDTPSVLPVKKPIPRKNTNAAKEEFKII